MVLLTPVVLATATRIGVRPAPHVYACGHLANSASLLLPVSNLTNLLAFEASGMSFLRFAAVMALVAAAGALALAVPRVRRGSDVVGLVRAANVPFCAFVFALGVVVLAVRSGQVGALVGRFVPDGGGFASMLAVARARRRRFHRTRPVGRADAAARRRRGQARPGPKSLGPHTRFVVDHAPCQVLLVWPADPPPLETMPPPPPH